MAVFLLLPMVIALLAGFFGPMLIEKDKLKSCRDSGGSYKLKIDNAYYPKPNKVKHLIKPNFFISAALAEASMDKFTINSTPFS